MFTSRRDFLKRIAAAGIVVPFSQWPLDSFASATPPDQLEVHVFSKHLQFLDYKETGAAAAEIGFSGVDLTVRPKGHVLPEAVKKELPKAIQEITQSGVKCELITTRIKSAANTEDREVISVAASEGVKYYRSDWFKYLKDRPMMDSLEFYQDELKKLSTFNSGHNIIGCYQNHAGTSIGSSYWEVETILNTVDPKYFGTQYDIRHAVVEGGLSWVNGLELLSKKIKTIVLKDFKWGKVNGKPAIINVPIGEGMVDFDRYFKLLKKYQLSPPVSLHLEYPLGGAEKGQYSISLDKKVVFDAMKKDLQAIQERWKNA